MPAEPFPYNRIQLEGNLGQDPEVRYSPSGSVKTEIRVAVYDGKNQAGESQTLWVTVRAWKDTADYIAENFRKGNRIRIVEGSLKEDQWKDKQGQNRRTQYVLAWKVEKVERPSSQEDYEF